MKPYPISYRSLVPKQAQCENLLVPICLAASHIAYGSIRMEPVFMILAESSATATAMAIDEEIPVQKVNYVRLRARLLAQKQVLDWTNTSPTRTAAKVLKLDGFVLDDSDAEKIGEWVESSSVPPNVGGGYIHDGNAHKGEMKVIFNPEIAAAGEYELFLISTPHLNRASVVPVSVTVSNGSVPVITERTTTVNQRTNAALSLGKYRLPKGRDTRVKVLNAGTDGYVAVDGLQIVPVK